MLSLKQFISIFTGMDIEEDSDLAEVIWEIDQRTADPLL